MSLLDRALLYARTLRELRWEQWVYRPVRRVQRRLPIRLALRAQPNAAERIRPLAAAVRAWPTIAPEPRMAKADEVLAGTFRFLNHAETLPAIDWSGRHVSHLWSYNLHYFDYALDLAWAFRETRDARYRDRFAELAVGWIAGNPPGQGDGWEPYALSLRVVNWIYALLLFGDDLDADTRARIERSAMLQTEFLSRRLELHILANHLQKNLKALVVSGLYFCGPSAECWLREGMRLLRRELFEQVLPDGGHYERSPMYHAIALADFLEVISLCRAAGLAVPAEVRERVGMMTGAFGVLCRADGNPHLFNDAAHGIAPERAWIDVLARRALGTGIPAPFGLLELTWSGYYGLYDPARGERLLADCGEPGPRYQPGHAHCDLLSYELDLAGRPVVVDAGVCGYDGDPLREYVRSTRAHNTVSIGGREQSEIWGTFRLARRARVLSAEHTWRAGAYRFEGAYSPYHDRRAVHRRVIERVGAVWTITDRVEGAAGASLQSFLHLHPDLRLENEGNAFVARTARLGVRIEPFGMDETVIARGAHDPPRGWHCPEFGVALPAATLEMRVRANDGRRFGYRLVTGGG